MNNKTLYTRCPTCNTAFKVTDELLELAGGKVRCGACLAVFQATDYMLRPSDRSQPEETQIANKQPENAAQENNLAIDNTAEVEEADNVLEPEPEPEPEPEENINQLTGEEENVPVEEATVEEQELEDDSYADDNDVLHELENIEIDHEDTLEEFNYENETFDFDDEPSDFDKDFSSDESVEDLEPTEESEAIEKLENAAGETLLRTQLELDADFDSDTEEQEPVDSDPSIEISGWDDEDGEDDDLFEEESSDGDEDEPGDESDYELDNEPEDELDEQFLSDESEDSDIVGEDDLDELSDQLQEQMQETDTDPDPLDEFDNIVQEEKAGVKTKLIYAVVGVIIAIAVWQFWSSRQALAWSENWGATVKSVCNYLPCNLQPKRDVSKIKLLQRQFSPDEEKENHLDIKILLMNEANFDQPYPVIKIAFSNKNGEQVSLKSFLPTEYLAADAQASLMPSGSEVHIQLNTEEAHPDALGFEFIFE